jgi:low temperature requirement protein LtrA
MASSEAMEATLTPPPATSEAAEPDYDADDHRVTPLELFFDLVFVFAFTQVTALMADHTTWEGLGQGMLVLAAVWFAWAAYSWLTNEVDAEAIESRLTVFTVMAAMLIAAMAIPGAFGGNALAFAIAYLIVRVSHIALFAQASRHVGAREAILRLAPTAIGGASLLVLAAAFDGLAQAGLWCLALLIDYGGPYAFGVEGYSVSPGHFAERFGLIVIIALGESIVAVGAGATGLPLDAPIIIAAVAGVVIAAGLWWTYFDVVAWLTQRRLTEARGLERNKMGRDVYSYLHLPMIAGIVLLALGIKKVLGHTGAPLDIVPAVALCGGVALYLLAHVAIRLRNIHSIAGRRLLAAAILLALIPAATEIDALVSVIVVALVVIGLVAWDTHVYGESRERVRAEAQAAG